MWKTQLNLLQKLNNHDIDEYIHNFMSIFHIPLWSLKRTIQKLNSSDVQKDLEPEILNLSHAFNNANLNLIINTIYYRKKNVLLSSIYTDFNKTINMLSFNFENLLSKQAKKRSLLFLFLYYFPEINKDNLLLLPNKSYLLIASPKIAKSYFNMLLYLEKSRNKKYDYLCYDIYLSHLYIGKDLLLYKRFPKKLYELFEKGYSFSYQLKALPMSFNLTEDKRNKLLMIEKNYFKNKLSKKLPTNPVRKLIKI